mgnify:CR=1 FL=1
MVLLAAIRREAAVLVVRPKTLLVRLALPEIMVQEMEAVAPGAMQSPGAQGVHLAVAAGLAARLAAPQLLGQAAQAPEER